MPPTTSNNNRVDVKSPAYDRMASRWRLINTLNGGTLRIRAEASEWLPREEGESQKKWECRVARSILYAAYKDTTENLAGKPFSRPLVIHGETFPTELQPIESDVDGLNRDINALGAEMLKSMIDFGLTHLLVDFPKTGGQLNLQEERQFKIRARFIHIKPSDMIGWKFRRDMFDNLVLSEIRFTEVELVEDGKYGAEEKKRIRVYRENDFEVWEKREDGEDFVLIESGNHTFGSIPLVTCYINKKGLMEAEPAMEDLAWLNLAHYQSFSDQRNILRFARVGILFASGLTQEEADKGLVIGPNQMFSSVNKDADMKYVEYTGKAIDAGENDLISIEAKMEAMGLRPLMRKKSQVTATQRVMDQQENDCELQSWIRTLERAFETAYQFAAKWQKLELPDDFSIDIFNDFALSERATQDIEILFKMWTTHAITTSTFLREMKQRAVLNENLDIDAEIEESKNNLGGFEDMPGENEGDEE